MSMQVQSFYHPATATFSYVVSDSDSGNAAIIDSVLDYDQNSAQTVTTSADKVVEYVNQNKLSIQWLLETHAHADHLSAAPYLKKKLGGKTAIGEGIKAVQHTFKKVFHLGAEFSEDGQQFDHLFKENEKFSIGNLLAKVIYTPGHTDDSVTYLMGDAAFIGDTLFMPDYGTARCDFPGGSSRKLYQSVQQIYALPDSTRLFLCHDYVPEGSSRKITGQTTVAKQKSQNVHVNSRVSEDEFVKMRDTRDATLSLPQLIIPSVQVNIRAGEMPPTEANGVSYLKVPINTFGR